MSFSKLFSRFLRTFQCNSEISLLFNFQRPNELAIANSAVLYVAVFCPQVDSLPIIQQSFQNVKRFLKSFFAFFNFLSFVDKIQRTEGRFCAILPTDSLIINASQVGIFFHRPYIYYNRKFLGLNPTKLFCSF